MTAEQFKAERAGGKEIMRLGSSETEGMHLRRRFTAQRCICSAWPSFEIWVQVEARGSTSGGGWIVEGEIRSKRFFSI